MRLPPYFSCSRTFWTYCFWGILMIKFMFRSIQCVGSHQIIFQRRSVPDLNPDIDPQSSCAEVPALEHCLHNLKKSLFSSGSRLENVKSSEGTGSMPVAATRHVFFVFSTIFVYVSSVGFCNDKITSTSIKVSKKKKKNSQNKYTVVNPAWLW